MSQRSSNQQQQQQQPNRAPVYGTNGPHGGSYQSYPAYQPQQSRPSPPPPSRPADPSSYYPAGIQFHSQPSSSYGSSSYGYSSQPQSGRACGPLVHVGGGMDPVVESSFWGKTPEEQRKMTDEYRAFGQPAPYYRQ